MRYKHILKITLVDILEIKYSYVSWRFQLNVPWFYSIHVRFYKCYLEKRQPERLKLGSVAMWVWEPVQWESAVTLEHFYSSLRWTLNLINARIEGQAGWGFLVRELPSSPSFNFSIDAKGCGGGNLFTVLRMQKVSVEEQKACMEEILLQQGVYSKSGSVCSLLTQLATGRFFN